MAVLTRPPISDVTPPNATTLQVDLGDSVDFNDGDVVQIVVEDFRNPTSLDDYDPDILPTDGQEFSTKQLPLADKLNIETEDNSDANIALGAFQTFFQGQKLFFEADEANYEYQIRFFASDADSGQGGLVDEFTTYGT